MPPPLMFEELAEYYDALVADKDYRAEAARLVAIARRFGRRGQRTWLDVACGTGRHLEHLRRRYEVAGVDASRRMLRIAQRRLPGVRLTRADMRSFRLGRTYDVVSCLFSAIGHLPSERAVRAAFRNFARHLAPGGVVLVEPWIDPATFRPGFLHLMAHESASATVVRLSHSARRGPYSLTRCHYLIGEPMRGIRHLQETDIGLLVAPAHLVQMMREAGLRARYLPRGVRPERGLIVGVRTGALT